MPHFSFKSWRAVCLTKILAPFIAGYYSWITHSTIDFNRSILDVYLFLHDKNRTHYISMIVSKIKKNWERQKSNNYMYFKVYGIFYFITLLVFHQEDTLVHTTGARIFYFYLSFINSLVFHSSFFFWDTSIFENHTCSLLFCIKNDKLLLYPCQFQYFLK